MSRRGADFVNVLLDDGQLEVNKDVMSKFCGDEKFGAKIQMNLLDEQEIKIQGVTLEEMNQLYRILKSMFLSSLPPVMITKEVCLLIKLSGPFGCEKLTQSLLFDEEGFNLDARPKLKCLEAADLCRNAKLVETCIRLCGNVSLDKANSLRASMGTRYAFAMFLATVREEFSHKVIEFDFDTEVDADDDRLTLEDVSKIDIDNSTFFC